MGICGSQETPEKKLSKQLDRQQGKDLLQDKRVNKLLLLGAGESGKSTLFKQMILLYRENPDGKKGMTEEDRKPYITIVNTNVITSMKELVKQSSNYGPIADQAAADHISGMNNTRTASVLEVMDAKTASSVETLWQDAAIQEAYRNRAQFQLNDSAKYFFDKIKEISAPGYLPSADDVLRSRVRTTGIVENQFEIEGNHFKMYDVGGQRNERKKWIHCFEHVTAVLFVAAISAYNQKLYENEDTNRVDEALDLFGQITSSYWFQKTSFILFLNKKDLFAEKIKEFPLSVWRPECTANDYESGTQYMVDAFLAKANEKASGEKQIYHHITCATDTQNVQVVFTAVKDIVIRSTLHDAGLFTTEYDRP
jgi:GTPase SAR1 family protein